MFCEKSASNYKTPVSRDLTLNSKKANILVTIRILIRLVLTWWHTLKVFLDQKAPYMYLDIGGILAARHMSQRSSWLEGLLNLAFFQLGSHNSMQFSHVTLEEIRLN
jgi:hypothetical protein